MRRVLPSLCTQRHQQSGDREQRTDVLCGVDLTLARTGRRHLPASCAQHRLQGRQHPRFLRALGQPARFRADARRRQPYDRQRRSASGSHHAGRYRARHPSGVGRGPAFYQCLRAGISVRYAAWHALLHHRQRLVAGRLRAILGPQRGAAARAVHRALRATGSGQRTERRIGTSSATIRSKRR